MEDREAFSREERGKCLPPATHLFFPPVCLLHHRLQKWEAGGPSSSPLPCGLSACPPTLPAKIFCLPVKIPTLSPPSQKGRERERGRGQSPALALLAVTKLPLPSFPEMRREAAARLPARRVAHDCQLFLLCREKFFRFLEERGGAAAATRRRRRHCHHLPPLCRLSPACLSWRAWRERDCLPGERRAGHYHHHGRRCAGNASSLPTGCRAARIEACPPACLGRLVSVTRE